MKKKFMGIMTMLVCFIMTMPVLAAESNIHSVWINTEEIADSNGTMEVPVNFDGNVTNGVLSVTYDVDSLGIEENQVVIDNASGIEMYSVNADEAGTVKISFLSETAIKKGQAIRLNFTVLDEEKAKNAPFGITGTTYGVNGDSEQQNAVGVITQTPAVTPGGSDVGDHTTPPNASNKPGTGTDNANTGDTNSTAVYLILFGFGVAVCGVSVYKVKKANS